MSKETPTRLKDLALKTSDAFTFTPDQLHIRPGFNVRHLTPEYEAGILELMEDIRVNGVKNPLIVSYKDGKAWVDEGHRRHEAGRRLQLQGHHVTLRAVPKIVAANSTPEDQAIDLNASLVICNDQKNLSPQEIADACKRLRDENHLTSHQITTKLNFSVTYVDGLLLLADASPEIIAMLDRHEFSAATAMQAIRDRGPEGALDLLKDATAEAALAGKEKATPKHVKKAKEKHAAETAAVLAQNVEPEEEETAAGDPGEAGDPDDQQGEDLVAAEGMNEDPAPKAPVAPAAKASPEPHTEASIQDAPIPPAQASQRPQEPSAPRAGATAPTDHEEANSEPPAPTKTGKAPKPAPAPKPEPLDYKKVALKLKSLLEEIFNTNKADEKAFSKAINAAAAYHAKTFPIASKD